MIIPCCRKKEETPHCSAVIVAAGSSQRMGSDKLLHNLGIMPVLARTLLVFQDCELVDEIVVVTRMEKLEEVAELCKKYRIEKASKVICGGATRMESALAGVSEVKKKAKLIAIHDGARPLVSVELIENTVFAAAKYKAAVPAIKSVDTLKLAEDGETVTGSLDRELVLRVQTPQVFDADLIKGALTFAAEKKLPLTDDCSAVELMGVKARIVPGEEDNIKLTTPRDMLFAAAILKDRGEYLADRAWV
ncbi:MAG: 2-C-methyl-D-erythritol 4-phosphate cytidylyltransferase [Candidatus Limivicinus sp.]|nr:2-C-methyl-D-erythritol 4-phosphate cytidylyltransferase [Clostridiales bacterium]MDY6133109.1 2-C-methyl-D-erythritol 4-phosphate cytidylyltransferase [Candidatus Limivicinus sp.]